MKTKRALIIEKLDAIKEKLADTNRELDKKLENLVREYKPKIAKFEKEVEDIHILHPLRPRVDKMAEVCVPQLFRFRGLRRGQNPRAEEHPADKIECME